MTLGLADLVVPNWLDHLLPTDADGTVQGFWDGIGIVLHTPYCLVAVVGVLLNAVMPADPEVEEEKRDRAEVEVEAGGELSERESGLKGV